MGCIWKPGQVEIRVEDLLSKAFGDGSKPPKVR